MEYVIQCSVRRSKDLQLLHWKVCRRFRQFHSLHCELKRYDLIIERSFTNLILINLCFRKYPRIDAKMPKRVLKLFGNFDKNFIEHRMELLNKYLNELVQLPGAGESNELLDFLSPDVSPCLTDEEGKEEDVEGDEDFPSDSSDVENVSECSFNEHSPRRKLRYSLGSDRSDSKRRMDREQVTLAELHTYKLLSEIFDFHEMGFFKKNLLTLLRTVIRLTLQTLLTSWLEESYSRKSAAELLTAGLQQAREYLWPSK